MNSRRLVLAALAALAGHAGVAYAQTCSFAGAAPQSCSLPSAHNLDATVQTVGKLTMSGGTTTLSATATDFEASETGLGTAITGPTLTARSNRAFNVTMSYPVTFSLPAASTKPQSDVAVQLLTLPGTCPGADGGYSALAGTSANLVTGVAPSKVDYLFCVKVKWNWASDGPGTYRFPVTFSIAAP